MYYNRGKGVSVGLIKLSKLHPPFGPAITFIYQVVLLFIIHAPLIFTMEVVPSKYSSNRLTFMLLLVPDTDYCLGVLPVVYEPLGDALYALDGTV